MGGSLLIVDDDRMSAEYTRFALQSYGFQVTVATMARDAAYFLAHQHCDIILLDITLPDANGYDFCQWLRNQKNDVLVLFISGHSEVESRLQAFAAGADDYIIKPYIIAELIAHVNAMLRRKSQPPSPAPMVLFDESARTLLLPNNTVVALTVHEARILLTLQNRRGEAMTLRSLIHAVWGPHTNHIEAFHAMERSLRELELKVRMPNEMQQILRLEHGTIQLLVPIVPRSSKMRLSAFS